ncbi:MAG: nucleotidyltransferase domain-containing protein [Promethearchaeota archaeon]
MNEKIKELYNNIDNFSKNVIKIFHPKCIILYGSLARGDFNERSDIDIIVIAKNLPENYFERAKLLYEQIKTPVPIEPLGYTPSEFIKMIYKRHCTSLFAMSEGIPLHGKKYFLSLKRIHKKIMKKYGIIKGEAAWIPKILNK